MKRLLLWLRDDVEISWLQLDGAQVEARGAGAVPGRAPADQVVAVVPGEQVVIHWVEMPNLAPAQAVAAARLLAADVMATSAAETHVAVGGRDRAGECCLAVVDASVMAGWLARCRAAGHDPDVIVPAPLLVPAPDEGLRVVNAGDGMLVRGRRTAVAAEPELAALLLGDAMIEELDAVGFDAGLATALAELPVNLRQGTFARQQPWRIDRRRVRRLAAVGSLALAAMLATELTLLLRRSLAADVAELQLDEAARRVLPRGTEITDPLAQVEARLAERRGSDFSPMAAVLLAALREVNGAQIVSLRYGRTGLVASLLVTRSGDLAAIEQRLSAAGYEVTVGAVHDNAGRNLADLTVSRK